MVDGINDASQLPKREYLHELVAAENQGLRRLFREKKTLAPKGIRRAVIRVDLDKWFEIFGL